MSYFVYLTDTESVKHMDRFWNNDMNTQNTTENIQQWIGGEYYIQTSLYNAIKDKSFCKIVCINITFDEELLKNAKYIITPGWSTISNEFIKYKDKLFSYRYFETVSDDFSADRVFTPWIYNSLNIFLPLTIIEQPNINLKIKYDSCGLLVGKCISHTCVKNKHTQLLKLIDNLPSKLLSTLRPLHLFEKVPNYLSSYEETVKEYSDKIINHSNIISLGIQNPIEFRNILLNCKYCIFYHGAHAPPTLIECLFTSCIVLSTINVIPTDLIGNPNIIIIDNLTFTEINDIITQIESGKRVFDSDNIPKNYTVQNKLDILQSYLDK